MSWKIDEIVNFQQEPFKELRENCPERLKKLLVVSGETTSDGLGLSTSNNELLINEISVIFHMAANVKFDLPLKSAVNFNTRGTFNVLALAKQVVRKTKNLHSLSVQPIISHALQFI